MGEANQRGLHGPRHEVNATKERWLRGREGGHNAEPASIYLLKTTHLVLENKERKPTVGQTDEKGEKEKESYFPCLPAYRYIPLFNQYQHEVSSVNPLFCNTFHLVGNLMPKLLTGRPLVSPVSFW